MHFTLLLPGATEGKLPLELFCRQPFFQGCNARSCVVLVPHNLSSILLLDGVINPFQPVRLTTLNSFPNHIHLLANVQIVVEAYFMVVDYSWRGQIHQLWQKASICRGKSRLEFARVTLQFSPTLILMVMIPLFYLSHLLISLCLVFFLHAWHTQGQELDYVHWSPHYIKSDHWSTVCYVP